ncbi:hypothetical protein BJ742DRAFT_743023 [Cladochytrium replicatum]|nr:hypothetical protein BJ742DRAFT_743023 [Cladochytrium replicatum]
MDAASAAKYAEILEWRRTERGRLVDLRWSSRTDTGRIEVNQWWLESGLEVNYAPLDVVKVVCRRGRRRERKRSAGYVGVLDQNDLTPFLYSSGISRAIAKGHVDVLEWWRKSGKVVEWPSDAINTANREGHVQVLNWPRESGLDLPHIEEAIDGQSFASSEPYF